MLQRKSSQREDFELGLHASHHLKNNPPKGRIPKRWDKNLVQEILPEGRIINRVLLIEGYLHISTFYSDCPCLFVCLFVSPSGLFPLIDGQWTSAKSNCTHSIRRGLGRRLRSSLLLNSSPSTSRDHPLVI